MSTNLVNDSIHELLQNGWELNRDEMAISKMYYGKDYDDLHDSGAEDIGRGVFIELKNNENGEFESNIPDYGTEIIIMKSVFPISSTAALFIESLVEGILDKLDPAGENSYYQFFYKLLHFEGEGDFFQCVRVIFLPVDIDYLNKSAEANFLIASGTELFITPGMSLMLDGEEVDGSLDWYARYLEKLHTLYPEQVWKSDKPKEEVKLDTIEELQAAAEQGHAEAQWRLGGHYCYGEGVPQNYEKATYWYQKAAEQGNENAQYSLGLCYDSGNGVPQSFEKAVYWYQQSAEQGNVAAQYNLAGSYKDGEGVPQSYEKAFYWYQKGAEQGDADAQNWLGVMYYNGQGVTRDFENAVYWYQKAARQGLAVAETNLGKLYFTGNGVVRDIEKASELINQAAEHGDEEAKSLVDEWKWLQKKY